MLVNTFLAGIFLVLLVFGGLWYYWKTKTFLEDYQASVERVITTASEAKAAVKQIAQRPGATAAAATGQQQAEEAGEGPATIESEIDKISAGFDAVATIVAAPTKSFGEKTFQEAKKPIIEAFTPVAQSFGLLGDQVSTLQDEFAAIRGDVSQLNRLEAYFDAVIAEHSQIRDEVAGTLNTMRFLMPFLAGLLGMLALWLGFAYVLWAYERLNQSRAFLRGHPA